MWPPFNVGQDRVSGILNEQFTFYLYIRTFKQIYKRITRQVYDQNGERYLCISDNNDIYNNLNHGVPCWKIIINLSTRIKPMNVNELSRLSTLNSTLRKREQGEQIILRSSPNNEDGLNRNLTNTKNRIRIQLYNPHTSFWVEN